MKNSQYSRQLAVYTTIQMLKLLFLLIFKDYYKLL